MFRASQRPSSGVPKTVSATCGIGHGIGTATSFHRGLIRTPNQATVEGRVTIPEAAHIQLRRGPPDEEQG
jgi:hypothetical protein